MKTFQSTYANTDWNLKLMEKKSGGVADCFRYPQKCEAIIANVTDSLRDVTMRVESTNLECFKHHYLPEILTIAPGREGSQWVNATCWTNGDCQQSLKCSMTTWSSGMVGEFEFSKFIDLENQKASTLEAKLSFPYDT